MVKEKMANMKASLTRVTSTGAAKSDTQEMMEEYVVECENPMKTGHKQIYPKCYKRNWNRYNAREKI